jgi:hypothetical protein
MIPQASSVSVTGRVVTLATGRAVYHEMAENIARSFLHWNRGNGLRFTLCTDRATPLPPDLADVEIVTLRPGECGSNFSPKLHLDRLVPDDVPAIFIDCDCLITGSLTPIFNRLAGHPFVLLGERASTGDFYGDIATLLSKARLPWMPIFVSSFFYWSPGATATAIFTSARDYESRYDALGLLRLRGAPSDEPALALALAAHQIEPLADDGSIKADAHLYDYPPKIDVLRGEVRFTNNDATAFRVIPNRLREARSLIAHFNASYSFEPPYLREALILRLVRARGLPVPLARLVAFLRFTAPHTFITTAKNALRPLYHRLAGVRTITPGPREQ